MKALYTNIRGNNSDLFKEMTKLYLKEGQYIADITYGKGVFWRQIDLSKYKFFPSDILMVKKAPYDFRFLPYKKESFDIVVFDPPYCHNPGQLLTNKNYKNIETTKGLYHADIIDLYREGMLEAKRILKPHGSLWVKCKDEIESSTQQWAHTEIYELATKIGMYGKDLFILCQLSNPVVQFKNQQHARKNHSYLWIFKKCEQAPIKPWFNIAIGIPDQRMLSWIKNQHRCLAISPELYKKIFPDLSDYSLLWAYIRIDIRKSLIELKNVILYSEDILNTEFRRNLLSQLPICRKRAFLFPIDQSLINKSDKELKKKLYHLEADYKYSKDAITEENFDVIEVIETI